jgi:hypothetical protein
MEDIISEEEFEKLPLDKQKKVNWVVGFITR